MKNVITKNEMNMNSMNQLSEKNEVPALSTILDRIEGQAKNLAVLSMDIRSKLASILQEIPQMEERLETRSIEPQCAIDAIHNKLNYFDESIQTLRAAFNNLNRIA